MIVLGMILLTEAGQQTDLRKGRFMAIIGLILVAIFFSLILSVFRSKAQGYPYRYELREIRLNTRFVYVCHFTYVYFISLSNFSFLFK